VVQRGPRQLLSGRGALLLGVHAAARLGLGAHFPLRAPLARAGGEIATLDPVWSRIRREAAELAASEPALASFLYASVLLHDRLESALSYQLAQRLGEMKNANPGQSIVIKGDAHTQYAKVMQVLEAMKRADITDIGLVTTRTPK
jgi:hypothetical protein